MSVSVMNASNTDRERITGAEKHIRTLGGVEKIRIVELGDPRPQGATTLAGHLEVIVELKGIIDKDTEIERAENTLDKLERKLAQSRSKFANPEFGKRAPKKVVKTERDRITETEASIGKLRKHLKTLGVTLKLTVQTE